MSIPFFFLTENICFKNSVENCGQFFFIVGSKIGIFRTCLRNVQGKLDIHFKYANKIHVGLVFSVKVQAWVKRVFSKHRKCTTALSQQSACGQFGELLAKGLVMLTMGLKHRDHHSHTEFATQDSRHLQGSKWREPRHITRAETAYMTEAHAFTKHAIRHLDRRLGNSTLIGKPIFLKKENLKTK